MNLLELKRAVNKLGLSGLSGLSCIPARADLGKYGGSFYFTTVGRTKSGQMDLGSSPRFYPPHGSRE